MARKNYRSWFLLFTLAVLAIITNGCNILAYPFYLFAPASTTKTIPAEFDGLDGRSVAIIIVAKESLRYEHPHLRVQLSKIIASELKKHLDDIKIVSADRIVRYQDANLDWESMDRTKLGKHFGADFVLQVTLANYAMRYPGSANLYRGNIVAEAELFDASRPPQQARVWRKPEIEVSYPEEGRPVGRINDEIRGMREKTDRRFAKLLVRFFRKYKVKVKP